MSRSPRPFALTTPTVSELSRLPNGLPTAMAQAPTSRASESPNSRTASRCPRGSMRSRARSVAGSAPTSVARYSRCSPPKRTKTSSAPSITWLLVRMSPEAATTKPEPVLGDSNRPPLPSSSGKNWRYISWSGLVPMPSAFTLRTVRMLTTAGRTARPTPTKGDSAWASARSGTRDTSQTSASTSEASPGRMPRNTKARSLDRLPATRRAIRERTRLVKGMFRNCLTVSPPVGMGPVKG